MRSSGAFVGPVMAAERLKTALHSLLCRHLPSHSGYR